jgi:hypothetical protein
MPIAAFCSESLARMFIEQAPFPQRDCLGIQRWQINRSASDPFWASTAFQTAAGNSSRLDEAYRRFRLKLLLYGADGHNEGD